jgi:hypothetical protein
MVWPFTSSDDPTDKLDPELRKFLQREAPKPAPPPKPQRDSYSTIDPREKESRSPQPQETSDGAPIVPQQSLFPDGRYAHIWKTYKPDGPSARAAQSDAEILSNLVGGYEWRKKEISKVALENCAFEAIAESDCFVNGGWTSKLFLCRDQTKALDRCTTLQQKFLHALGYLEVEGRSPNVEERIQMHSDRLYQQMLKHEAAVKEAKENDLPPPVFKPVLSRENLARVLGVKSKEALTIAEKAEVQAKDTEFTHVNEDLRSDYKESVKDMTPDERLAEEASQLVRAKEKIELAKEYHKFKQQKATEVEQRRAEGKETWGEKARRWWQQSND